ncbi:MAG: hypothetical protein ABIA04_01375 [Pseudomonadota bacterium]
MGLFNFIKYVNKNLKDYRVILIPEGSSRLSDQYSLSAKSIKRLKKTISMLAIVVFIAIGFLSFSIYKISDYLAAKEENEHLKDTVNSLNEQMNIIDSKQKSIDELTKKLKDLTIIGIGSDNLGFGALTPEEEQIRKESGNIELKKKSK